MSAKGPTEKPFIRVGNPKTWMTWVKLNCFKSSGKLETWLPHDTTARVVPQQQHLEHIEMRNPLAGNKGQ